MLITGQSLEEYFKKALCDAFKRTAVQVTENTEAYLVSLLSEFTRSENAFAGVAYGEKPALVLLWHRAEEANASESVRILKHLGDSSLYTLGFFRDSKNTQFLGTSYYATWGEAAYNRLASTIRSQAAANAALYAELAERFVDLAEVLRCISQESLANLSDPVQLIELIEQYKRTKDPKLLEQLEYLGVVVQTAGIN
jgi:hypothetical protein